MKHLTIAFLFLLLNVHLGAQAPGRFELGFYSGVEMNMVTSSNPDVIKSYESMPAFNIGFRLQHHFSDQFSIVGGFDYSYVQFKFIPPASSDPNNPIFWDKGILKYDMVRAPILFQWNFGQKKSKFVFNVGPDIIFSLNDRNRTYTYTFGSAPDVVNYINLGAAASAGYSYSPKPWLKFYTEASLIVPLAASPYNGYYVTSTTRVLSAGWKIGISFRLRQPKSIEVNN